jgi:hypothetical protein
MKTLNEKQITELFNKYKDIRIKEPFEEVMTFHSFKYAIKSLYIAV